jgi:uncharacterized membrane protein YhaH (DUF805 family)
MLPQGATMDPIDLLFGFKGRINRAKYWLVVLIWFVAWLITLMLAWMSTFSIIAIVLAAIVAIVGIVVGVAVGIKRLHDRNKTGWWLLLFYLAPGVLDAITRGTGSAGMVFSFASLAISVWAIVELGCLRGTIGPNPYGPDPVAPKPATH